MGRAGLGEEVGAERARERRLLHHVGAGELAHQGLHQPPGVQRLAQHARQSFAVVAHHGFEPHFDAERVQFIGEKKRVRVQALGREKLGADGDDFRIH